jgi:hypothetical protein
MAAATAQIAFGKGSPSHRSGFELTATTTVTSNDRSCCTALDDRRQTATTVTDYLAMITHRHKDHRYGSPAAGRTPSSVGRQQYFYFPKILTSADLMSPAATRRRMGQKLY